MKIRLICIFIISSVVLSEQVFPQNASGTKIDDPYIRWIASLPSGDRSSDIGFFEKIFNFFVGYEPVVFNNPVYIYADGLQNYWIINQGDGTILHNLNGKVGKAPIFKKTDNLFPSMVAICSLNSEGMLFTDSKLNSVFSFTDDGKNFRIFNDTNSLDRPTGIAFSELTGEIWVVETGSHQISVFNRNGERIRTVGQRGTGRCEFNFPTYIWIDSSGIIYIVDSMNFRIQVLSSKGDYITAFGQQGNATGYFARPRGIATDSKGNIYVVDALFNVVQIFDIKGNLLYYFGSQGSGNYQFWMPSGIFIDKKDYIYISDSYNGRVQIFQLIKNIQK